MKSPLSWTIAGSAQFFEPQNGKFSEPLFWLYNILDFIPDDTIFHFFHVFSVRKVRKLTKYSDDAIQGTGIQGTILPFWKFF